MSALIDKRLVSVSQEIVQLENNVPQHRDTARKIVHHGHLVAAGVMTDTSLPWDISNMTPDEQRRLGKA